LDKGLLGTITKVFKPQVPLWACELTAKHIIIAGVNSRRTQVAQKWMSSLPTGDGIGAMQSFIRDVLNQVEFRGSEIVLVVPDETARIAFVTAESLSKNTEEQESFIRWKLKKTIPFDVDTAQIAFSVLGPHRNGSGTDLLVALSPRSAVEEYEKTFDAMDIHAGMILPSTLAALNLVTAPVGDALFLKIGPDSMTTTIFQNRRVQFYRRVTDVSAYDAVYPTVMYYQDKLGGQRLDHIYVCGYDTDLRYSLDEIQQKLGVTPQRIDPKGIDDIFKPSLGAVHLKAEATV
jgi:hypothetical protein